MYHKDFTSDKIQLTVNGKRITTPNTPKKGSTITFKITKDNFNQIIQSGKIQ